MKKEILTYLKNLKAYGIKENIPNVTETVGQFLNMMIKIKKPKSLLEIGCANGYSTIWLAEAVKEVGGHFISIDFSRPSMADAKKNLEAVDLSDYVDFHFDNALKLIPKLPETLSFDFVFVDGQKASYLDFWKLVEPRLSPKALVIFDDMIAFPEKTAPFSRYLQTLKGYDQLLLPIDEGDGILLLMKQL